MDILLKIIEHIGMPIATIISAYIISRYGSKVANIYLEKRFNIYGEIIGVLREVASHIEGIMNLFQRDKQIYDHNKQIYNKICSEAVTLSNKYSLYLTKDEGQQISEILQISTKVNKSLDDMLEPNQETFYNNIFKIIGEHWTSDDISVTTVRDGFMDKYKKKLVDLEDQFRSKISKY